MSDFQPLLDRNAEFATTGAHAGLAPVPNHQVFAVTCMDPRVDPAHVLGVGLEKTKDYAEAESALRQAVERIPDYERIWAVLGEVTMRLAAEHDEDGLDQEERGAEHREGRDPVGDEAEPEVGGQDREELAGAGQRPRLEDRPGEGHDVEGDHDARHGP